MRLVTQKYKKLKRWLLLPLMFAIAGLMLSTIYMEKSMRDEAAKHIDKLSIITAKEAQDIFAKSAKESMLLYVYASWCGTCRWYTPAVNKIAKEGKIKVIAISIDYTSQDLAYYLYTNKPIHFTPYYIVNKESHNFRKMIGEIAPGYSNSIPFIVVMKPGYMKIVEPNLKNFFSIEKAIGEAIGKL